MGKRMTKEQRADALLAAAGKWQNMQNGLEECPVDFWNEIPEEMDHRMKWPRMRNNWASAALSEVSALGYDIDGAEKVARMCPVGGVRREDGSKFAIYRGERL